MEIFTVFEVKIGLKIMTSFNSIVNKSKLAKGFTTFLVKLVVP